MNIFTFKYQNFVLPSLIQSVIQSMITMPFADRFSTVWKVWRYGLFFMLVMIGLLIVSVAQAEQSKQSQGSNGVEQQLDKLVKDNKFTYVDFWASWCVPCRASFPWMDDLQADFAKKGLKVVAVSLDENKEDADNFLTRFPVGFTILFDSQGVLAEKYQLKGMPSSYLLDKQGNILLTHIGFTQRDASKLRDNIASLINVKK